VTSQDEAWERMKYLREVERRQLAAVQGITLPAMPPRLPGETDKDYGVRIAWIAKSFCGPARKKSPPKPLPRARAREAVPAPPPEPDERLAGMDADFTTSEDP
jgi:hypothetical protein